LGAYVSSSGAEHKLMALSGTQATPMATMGHQGVWIRYEQGGAPHFLHIGHIVNATHLAEVTTYVFDAGKDQALRSVSYAETARIEKGRWVRLNVQQSNISTDKITAQHWDRRVETLGFDARLLISAGTTPTQYTLTGLYDYIQVHAALKVVPPDLRWYDFIFWKRVFQPLLTLLVILLAVPCMVGSLRSVPMGFRLLVGLVLGLALHLTGALLGSLSSVGYLSPLLAAGLPASVFLFIGLWFVWRSCLRC
jgi:lipopolysaccharide export system permease protein